MKGAEKLTTSFNLMLGKSDILRIDALQDKLAKPRSVILRAALQFFHSHEIDGNPTCANGSRCLVPHLHQPIPQAPAPAAAAIEDAEERHPLDTAAVRPGGKVG